MNTILRIIRKLFINKVAYAIDEYVYRENKDSNSESYYRINKVIILDISLDSDGIKFLVEDYKTNETWGDYIENVFTTKRAAEKRISKLCKV